MALLVLDKIGSPHGDVHACLVCAWVHIDIHDISLEAKQRVESVLYSLAWAYRFHVSAEKTSINKIHPLTEIIALCAMAFPHTNEWVQNKICRSLVGKNIIKPTDEYVDAQEDYTRKHYPKSFPTRNMRILAPRYALHLATKRALEVLSRPSINDVQKVICSLPFSVASRQDFPLDAILLDENFDNIDSEAFALGIIQRVKQEHLTFDQKSLMMRSVQIMMGKGEL